MVAATTLIDLGFHFRQSYYTLFYAVFTVQTARFIWALPAAGRKFTLTPTAGATPVATPSGERRRIECFSIAKAPFTKRQKSPGFQGLETPVVSPLRTLATTVMPTWY